MVEVAAKSLHNSCAFSITYTHTHTFVMNDGYGVDSATPRSGKQGTCKLKGMNPSPWQCLSLEFRQLISYKCFVPE